MTMTSPIYIAILDDDLAGYPKIIQYAKFQHFHGGNHRAQLVLNALSHQQPMKVVTHGVCDVVVLALSYDESRCSIQH